MSPNIIFDKYAYEKKSIINYNLNVKHEIVKDWINLLMDWYLFYGILS